MEETFEDSLNGANFWRQFRCFSALYWISINIGLSVGLTTLQSEALVNGGDQVQMTDDQVVWFTSMFSLVAMVGQLLGGLTSNRLGRRVGAMLVCPLFSAGYLCYWSAPTSTVLYIGRLCHGLACGMQHTAVASYLRYNHEHMKHKLTSVIY